MNNPYFNDNGNFILYQGDVCQMLSEIKDKVDVVFADPPYFLSSCASAFSIPLEELSCVIKVTGIGSCQMKSYITLIRLGCLNVAMY